MWGSIFAEASIQQNFNFGFSSSKSDILIHLSQWQYWWWFWFSLIWVAYYYIIVYSITKRSFNFNPVINTSLRGHGKWGDFLVALIPLSWCGNILVNSNFILRMIEWQNESSLFTLRVQGKQWYWVYKYDAAAATSIAAAPKNIGHNRWFSTFKNESYIVDSYYQAIHLAAQLEFQNAHSSLLIKKTTDINSIEQLNLQGQGVAVEEALQNHKTNTRGDNSSSKKFNPALIFNTRLKKLIKFLTTDKSLGGVNSSAYINTLTEDNLKVNLTEFYSGIDNNQSINDIPEEVTNILLNVAEQDNTAVKRKKIRLIASSGRYLDRNCFIKKVLSSYINGRTLKTGATMTQANSSKVSAKNSTLSTERYHFEYSKLDETTSTNGTMRWNTTTTPLRLVEGILNSYAEELLMSRDELTKNILFNWKFNSAADSFNEKKLQSEDLWGFRQKKYKRLKKFLFAPSRSFDPHTLQPTNSGISTEAQKIIRKKGIKFVPKLEVLASSVNTKVKPGAKLAVLTSSANTTANPDAKSEFLTSSVNTKANPGAGQFVRKLKLRGDRTRITKADYIIELPDKIKKRNEKSAVSTYDYYKAIKNNRHRSDLLSVTLARRLLRTKRTLVLPAHINITVITNSYDVVHSWFIPGLGIKMDCVPGRSTHHTFYIDNVGFYYGQCAEICGRYHHHMPIRICALPFEHFLVWWHKKGLPRLNRINNQGVILERHRHYNSIRLVDTVENNRTTKYRYTW